MIRTVSLAAAASFVASSVWAHTGHGAMIVDGHSHAAEVAVVVAAAAGLGLVAYRYLRSRK